MNREEIGRLNKLFHCVAHEVSASGGDGWGTIVFRNTPVKEVADAFEKWKEENAWKHWLPYRIDNIQDGSVVFTDKSNENITFVSKKAASQYPPHWRDSGTDEIWIEVW